MKVNYLLLFVFSILIACNAQTTGLYNNPTQGNFLWVDINGIADYVYATQITGSNVLQIPVQPTGNTLIYNLVYNQLYNATTLIYLNALDLSFYSFNFLTNDNPIISTSQLVGFTGNQDMAQHPNGTVYMSHYSDTSPFQYELYLIADLITPVTQLLWSVGTNVLNNNTRSIAIRPDGLLYGGHYDGNVYQLDWATGTRLAVITGYPTFTGVTPIPRVWIAFDNTGNTLYIPVFNSTFSFVAAINLVTSTYTLTLPSPLSFYSRPWIQFRDLVYYDGVIADGITTGTTSFTTGAITTSPFTSGLITTSPLTTSPLTTSPLTTSPLTSGQITTSPLTSGLITTSPLTTSPLTTNDVSTGAISTGSISTGSISTGEITTSPPITSSPITSGQITTSPLTSGLITTSPLTTSPLTSGSVTTSSITTFSITSGDISTNIISTGAISTSEITSSPLTTSPLTSGIITTSPLTSGIITTSPLTSGRVTTSYLTSVSLTSASFTTSFSTLTTESITSGSITTGDDDSSANMGIQLSFWLGLFISLGLSLLIMSILLSVVFLAQTEPMPQ